MNEITQTEEIKNDENKSQTYKIRLKDYSLIRDYIEENGIFSCVQIHQDNEYKKLFDTEELKKIECICRSLQEKINNGDIGNIKIINDLSVDDKNSEKPIVFGDFNYGYWTKGYVGVIYDGENQIEIGSRFDDGDKQYFLQYIFSKTLGVDVKLFKDVSVSGSIDKTLDIFLLFTFIQQLKKALKKGTYRRYKEFYYNDSKVKGQIDIARHIRVNNRLDNGKIAYHTREYTSNNMNNVLILNAYEMMRKKYPDIVKAEFNNDKNLLSQIEMLKQDNPGWDCYRNSQILNATRKKIVNSVYHDYETLRQTSLIIIKKLGINPYDVNKNQVNAILIDMPKLWEQFLEKTVFAESGYEGQYKAQEEFVILDGKRKLRPDFYNKDKKVVIDAKYKNNWSNTMKNNDEWGEDTREDIYQVMAYMLSLKCKLGGVIFPYPQQGENDSNNKNEYKYSVHPTKDEEYGDDIFIKIPIGIPSSKECEEVAKWSCSDFHKHMDIKIKDVKEYIKNIVVKND